jgi:Protein of unknown function (DUF2971)
LGIEERIVSEQGDRETFGQFIGKRMPAPPRILYHYTSASGLMGIVEKKEIWATKIDYLNDAHEFWHAHELAFEALTRRAKKSTKAVRFALGQMKERLERRIDRGVFVASFSEEGDLLSQWRAYCPAKGGFSIGFPTEVIFSKRPFNQDLALQKCIYAEREQRRFIEDAISWCLEPLHRPSPAQERNLEGVGHSCAWNFFFLMTLSAPILKSPGFAEEKEWRLVLINHDSQTPLFRASDSIIVPYLPLRLYSETTAFALSRVVVGPTGKLALSFESLKSYLAHSGISCKAATTKVPLRNW